MAGFDPLFSHARQLIAVEDWGAAEPALRRARQAAVADGDAVHARLIDGICFERQILCEQTIPAGVTPIDPDDIEVSRRRPEILLERLDGEPQTVFVLRVGNRRILGRKLLSPLWCKGVIDERYDGQISASMLVGKLEQLQLTEDMMIAAFRPRPEHDLGGGLRPDLPARGLGRPDRSGRTGGAQA